MNEIIRKANIEDSYNIARIKIQGWQTAYKGIIDEEYLSNMSIDEESEKRQKNIKDGMKIYVYEKDNIIKGFVWFGKAREDTNIISEDIFEIYAIYVNAEDKYNGIGTKLFNFAKNEAKKQNYNKMYLFCLKDNFDGRKFYEKNSGVLNGAMKAEIGKQDLIEVRYEFNI